MKAEPDPSDSRIQCVEFARQWLCEKMRLIFQDVDIAADIWHKIDFYTHVDDGRQLPVASILNGATRPPEIGDLIIYGREFLTTGHVAVITEVDLQAGIIGVGEQNYCNRLLPPDHVRRIPLIRNGANYWLLDGYLIGWKQMEAVPAGIPRHSLG